MMGQEIPTQRRALHNCTIPKPYKCVALSFLKNGNAFHLPPITPYLVSLNNYTSKKYLPYFPDYRSHSIISRTPNSDCQSWCFKTKLPTVSTPIDSRNWNSSGATYNICTSSLAVVMLELCDGLVCYSSFYCRLKYRDCSHNKLSCWRTVPKRFFWPKAVPVSVFLFPTSTAFSPLQVFYFFIIFFLL